MGRLSPANPDIPSWGFSSPSYLRGRYLDKGRGTELPSYESLIMAVRMQAEVAADQPDRFYNHGLELVFNQTALRRFEFLDTISCALERGDLDERLVDVHPFRNELRTFEETRNTVLDAKPDNRYAQNINLIRVA